MSLRRIPVWVGYTDPSPQEAAAEIDPAEIVGDDGTGHGFVGVVLDLSTNEQRIADGRTIYANCPVVGSNLGFGDLVDGDGTIELDGGGEVSFHSSEIPGFEAIPELGFLVGGVDDEFRTVIGGGGIAFGDGANVADIGIGWASANRAGLINPAGGSNAWLTLPADPVNGSDAARRSWVLTQITNLIAAAPGALDTLDELAAALGDDANFAATVTTALAGKQPLDADLSALAALASAADKLAYATGSGTWSLTDFSAFARTLLDDANAAAARTTLGLATAQAPVIDNGAATTNTAETSILAGTMSIGANVPAVGDEFDFEAHGITVNLSGGSLNFTLRFKVGGTTVASQVYAIGALAGIHWRVRGTISFEGISPSPIIWTSTTYETSTGAGVPMASFTNNTATPGLTHATTSAIAAALTAQHSGASMQTECYRASLRARPRI